MRFVVNGVSTSNYFIIPIRNYSKSKSAICLIYVLRVVLMNIIILGIDSPLIKDVKKLWRNNSNTLGFFPDGAFTDHLIKRRILGVLDEDGAFVGYLIYRINKNLHADIVHLCIKEQYKGKGCARLLVNKLIKIAREKNLRGIGLFCRRDNPAYSLWPKLGLAPYSKKLGRGKDFAELTYYWNDFSPPDLLSSIDETDNRLKVVLDNNVFRDLHDTSHTRNQEARFLGADWLQGQIRLCIVKELLVELDRQHSDPRLRELLYVAQKYDILKTVVSDNNNIRRGIEDIFSNENPTQQDLSDMMLIIQAIEAKADVFLTRDEVILDKSTEIEAQYRLKILRPSDLIVGLDEIDRVHEYQPIKLLNTIVVKQRVRNKDSRCQAEKFHNAKAGETTKQFLANLRTCFSSPVDNLCEYSSIDENLLSLTVSRKKDGYVSIPVLRSTEDDLGVTALQNFILEICADSSREKYRIIQVTDKFLTQSTQNMLHDLGFHKNGDIWEKVAINYIGKIKEVRDYVEKIDTLHNVGIINAIEEGDYWDVERRLWPLKCCDSNIATWIVPIKKYWASQLFDKEFAYDELFGAQHDLVLNRENVYYSAAINSGMVAPGRVLWYVSKDIRDTRTMSIRACSRLVEVVTLPPKDLFRKFRRLGIYEFRDLLKLANNDLNKFLVGFRFADTELFECPVPYEFTRNMGIVANFQSPLKISNMEFEKIYRQGMNFSDF